jgi:peptidoglycan glycosyltransferase
VLAAGVAFTVGLISAAGSPEEDAANRFVEAWADQDFAAMHAELTSESQAQYPVEQLAAAYNEAQAASTADTIDPGEASGPDGDVITMEVGIGTEIFGEIDGELKIPFRDQKIAWDPHLTFPGLAEGERVGRRLTLGDRAAILAQDGTPLAEGQGANRDSRLGSDAIDVTGRVESPDAELQAQVESSGYPGDQETGVSGLELAFNSRLAGTPGGELLAVADGTDLPDVPKGTEGRVLATAEQKPGQNVPTTIDPDLQEVTVAALAGRSGGAVALDARTGAVKALAGSAYSLLQPPGSTFKVITATAALEDSKVKLDDEFDVVTEINPAPDTGARVIENAHDELCGGTFEETFAESCNTVFAPLGVEVGAEKLVAEAEEFGFNTEPTLYDAKATAATKPPPQEMPSTFDETGTELSVSAIGQGTVLATPLGMASVAQTIANGGVRSPTPIVSDPELQSAAQPVQVTSKENARVMRSLMEAVVDYGTGSAAAISGVQVAGKTGTAELGPKPNQPDPGPLAPGQEAPEPEQIVDAWFIAFAPARKPKIAVAVMLVDADGDGGEVAAPIAREILAAGA